MIDITFITSNQTKIAHARHLCREYDVNILQYKKIYYGKGYVEPRLFSREELLKESMRDAIDRWKRNVSNYGNRLFFIEDTSVKIESLSSENEEIPGVDIKYWMKDYNFKKLNNELLEKGNNRKAVVSSHIVLFLTNEIKKQSGINEDYIIFSSSTSGTIVEYEREIETQILYPWLDNKSFNKWFVPEGYSDPISLLDIQDADKVDFRRNAFEKMLFFLNKNRVIKHINKPPIFPKLSFNPFFVICGPTCAGKSTVGRLLLEKYDYYHVEASDFMAVKYFETHGTKFEIDKNNFASEILKIKSYVVVENSINYILSKNILDNLIITGFRTPDEVKRFMEYFSSQDINLVFIDANFQVRFERWSARKRDSVKYNFDVFKQINELQNSMGLYNIKDIDSVHCYQNNKQDISKFKIDFARAFSLTNKVDKDIGVDDICLLDKISLEKAILFALAIEYRKNENKYFTTTEISHLINSTFINFKKNKNNVSRYFNQAYYPYYEIRRENRKNKFKLSPTGYSEAIYQIELTIKNYH